MQLLYYSFAIIVSFITIVTILIKLLQQQIFIKELHKSSDPDIDRFIDLYQEKVPESLRINTEEVWRFVICKEKRTENVQHYIFLAKTIRGVIGFIKVIYNVKLSYCFISYLAIRNENHIPHKCVKLLVKKVYSFFVKKRKIAVVFSEVEKNTINNKSTMAKLAARYAKEYKITTYQLELDYIQPKMPGFTYNEDKEKTLSLVYFPIYTPAREFEYKNTILQYIKSIYFDIYYPSCKCLSPIDNEYQYYLMNLINRYRGNYGDFITLIRP